MKIKALIWNQLDEWFAESPVGRTGGLTIYFEEGRYWGTWVGDPVEGHDTLEAAKESGQRAHNNFISQWLED